MITWGGAPLPRRSPGARHQDREVAVGPGAGRTRRASLTRAGTKGFHSLSLASPHLTVMQRRSHPCIRARWSPRICCTTTDSSSNAATSAGTRSRRHSRRSCGSSSARHRLKRQLRGAGRDEHGGDRRDVACQRRDLPVVGRPRRGRDREVAAIQNRLRSPAGAGGLLPGAEGDGEPQRSGSDK